MPDEVPPPPSGCPVNDFTPFAPDYLADPYAVLDGLRDTPVFYSNELGYLVVTRMEDVSEIFLDPATFGSQNVQDPVFPLSAAAHAVLDAPDFDPVAVMSNRQPPDHGRIRNHTKQGFSNRRMRILEPYIRGRSHDLADALLAAGSPTDFVPVFAHPLPGETIFRFIGFPESDDEKLKAWCSDRLAFSWGKPTEAEQAEIAHKMLAYWRYCRSVVAAKVDEPGDDFASELLAVHKADPDELTYREVESIVYGLSFAGHEIVSHFLSNSLICLLSRPDQWDQVCADPSLIPAALEEVLRFESPQTSWRRVANVDAEVAGVKVPAGDQHLHEPGRGQPPARLLRQPRRVRRPPAQRPQPHLLRQGHPLLPGGPPGPPGSHRRPGGAHRADPVAAAGGGPEPGALRQHHLPRPRKLLVAWDT